MVLRTFYMALMVGVVTACGGETGTASAPQAAATPVGETTYQRFCFSCHAAGVAGAPKMGDAAAWAPRIAKGEDALLVSTINGVPPGMPAKGLCMQCTEDDLRDAIRYMVERSR